jgi:ABC-type antimicrobial peptide transport system permease subunit
VEIVRDLTRRTLRNFVTISAIVIAVLALTTMGAIAEKFNKLLLAMLFAVGLSAAAGFFPALRAGRLDPVRALRSQ